MPQGMYLVLACMQCNICSDGILVFSLMINLEAVGTLNDMNIDRINLMISGL